MAKSYTIAIVPFDSWGHINPSLGIAQTLSRMGHKCVFVVNQVWSEVIDNNGFESRVYQKANAQNTTSNDYWTEMMAVWGPTFKLSPIEQIRAGGADSWTMMIEDVKSLHQSILDILLDIKPDGIVLDNIIINPAVQLAGVPWIEYLAGNPLFWRDERLPPIGSGLPADGDKQLWKEFYDEEVALGGKTWDKFNEWLESIGAPQLEHSSKYMDPSPYLNIICYAKELSYDDIAQKDPEKFVYVDNFERDIETNDLVNYEKFEIPDQLKNKPGNLVYLSMGSMACAYLELMERLISILSKSKHRFIVSKGPLGDRLELTDNMWGQKALPQLQVLRVVDAVITHGGNNTVSECMAAGTPMIVMPMYADQFDNAQRIQEKGLGLRVDAFRCTESELLSAVDSIVNDRELKAKYRAISERIKRDNSKQRAAEMMIEVIERSEI